MLDIKNKDAMETNEKISQLQGLRGVAMLGIFIMHTFVFYTDSGGARLTHFVNQLGTIGVIVFFMLSGFLLVYKEKKIPHLCLKDRWTECAGKFYKLRVLYVVTMVVAFIGRFPQKFADWVYTVVSIPLNLLYLQDLVPHTAINNSFNGPAWYISAMFVIWLIVYSIPNLTNSIQSKNAKQCSIIAVIIIVLQCFYKGLEAIFPVGLIPINHPDLYMTWIGYFSPFWNLGFFYLGGIVGRLAKIHKTSSVTQSVISIIVLIGMFLCFYEEWYNEYCKSILIEIMIGFLMLSMMSNSSFLAKVLSVKTIVWFGNISACFFLIHGVVNYNLRYVEGYVQKPLLFFISFFISIVLSVVSNKYIMLKNKTK